MTTYKFKINNVDCSAFVERDSYETSLSPIYSNRVTTMDGVDHTALVRVKGEVRVKFNPMTDAQSASLWAALSSLPATVEYHCFQRNLDVSATMTLTEQSAKYLSRCLANGDKWFQIGSLTLTEL